MAAAPQLTEADWVALEREWCERYLVNFVRQAWSVLEPATDYCHGWHIDLICDHLEAITRGDLRNLVINIPPRHMKSLLVSVMWPAWVWAKRPETRWLFASYAQSLSTRDALKMRRLIMSPWYQRLWGNTYALTSDQNAKMRFENDRTGYRIATSVGAIATGEGGDVVAVDDPHSASQARSQAERENALVWWDETMSTRLNDPRKGAKVIIMQRLHERDLSGHVLEQGGYEHLCLPAEFELDNRCITEVGADPRTEAGEPIWPDRMGADDLAQQRTALGEVGYAGQFQQRPMPRGGGMFPVDRFQVTPHKPAPGQIKASVRFWDKAGTKDSGAYTAGVLMHLLADGSYVVADVVRGQWSALEREQRIKQTAQADGQRVTVWVEQEPGSGGKESAESTIRNLSGFRVYADRVTGDKETRADPYAAQVEGANVWLVQGEWNRPFIQEHEVFPAGQYKDQVDAAAGAFAKLAKRPAEVQTSRIRGLM
jgi:predicted phage terminase large subunit-like protein